MVLAIDAAEEYIYLLLEKKMVAPKSPSPQKRRTRRLRTMASVGSLDYQDQKTYQLAKVSLTLMKTVEIYKLTDGTDDYKTAQEIFTTSVEFKNKVEVHFEEAVCMFILRFVPMQAVVAFTVPKQQSVVIEDGQAIRKCNIIFLRSYGECLGIVTQPFNPSKRKSTRKKYFSIGKPRNQEPDKLHGFVKCEISREYINHNTQMASQPETHRLAIEENYFENNKLDHAVTLNRESLLIFGAMTQADGSELYHLRLSAETTRGQVFKDVWSFDYPIFAYREIEQSKIRLCNVLLPESPQIQINLQTHRVKTFVRGSHQISRHQMRSMDSNIVMLVARAGEIQNPRQLWLMVLNFSIFNTEFFESAFAYLA